MDNAVLLNSLEPSASQLDEVETLEVYLPTGSSRATYIVPVGDGVVDGSDILNHIINRIYFLQFVQYRQVGPDDIVIYCAPDIPTLFAVVFALRLRRCECTPFTKLPIVRIDDRLSSMPPSEIFSAMKRVHETIRSLLLEECYMWLDDEWLQARIRLFETGKAHGHLPAELSAYVCPPKVSNIMLLPATTVVVASFFKSEILLRSINSTEVLIDREQAVRDMKERPMSKKPFSLSIIDPSYDQLSGALGRRGPAF